MRTHSVPSRRVHPQDNGFDPLRTLLDHLGAVDFWAAQCHDERERSQLLHEAEASGYAQGAEGSTTRSAGRGRRGVNRQLRAVLRAALIRLGRSAVAKIPHAERPTSLTINRLGALVKEVEVDRYREKLGDKHPATLTAINGLAGLHMANGELQHAEGLYLECLRTRRELLGNSDPSTLISINNLGALRVEQGDLEGATALLGEALASRRRELGPLDPVTLKSLDNMGKLHRARGDHARAIGCFSQAVEGRRKALGARHEETLRSMLHLSSALYDHGMREPAESRKAELDDAEATYREALSSCKQTLGASHALTLDFSNSLGNLLHARALLLPKFLPGRGPNAKRVMMMEESASLLRDALQACQAVHGSRRLESLISRSNLGSALRSLGADKSDQKISDEASGLIKEAVAGLADACTDLDGLPRMRASLLEGLGDLDDDGGAVVDKVSA